MGISSLLCLVALSFAAMWQGCLTQSPPTSHRNHNCPRQSTIEQRRKCDLCNFRNPKKVTLVIKNILREPTFQDTVTLNCTISKYLWGMLQEAADVNQRFRFSASYFNNELGFFIDKINGLAGNWSLDQTYWEILNGTNQQTSLGASSYQPKNGETVTFNFTVGGHTS